MLSILEVIVYSYLQLTCQVTTPFEGCNSLMLEAGVRTMDPYSANLKGVKDSVEHSVHGSLALNRKEFNMNAVTPYEGFEVIKVNGKFGATSTGHRY